MTFNMKVGGEYNIVIKKPDGTEIETGWFPNLILNQGLDMMGASAGASPIQYASVGTGSSTPIPTQTSLDSNLGGYSTYSANAGTSNAGAPTYAGLHTQVYSWPQGAVVGNITEIGIGMATANGSLFSRALILDSLGAPTSITLISIDQLIVYYRLSLTPPLTDITGTMVLDGVTYNYTSRIVNALQWGNVEYIYEYPPYFNNIYGTTAYGPDAALVPITTYTVSGDTGGTSSLSPNVGTSTYINGSYHVDWTFAYPPGYGNTGSNGAPWAGIGGFRVTGGGPWSVINFQVVLSSPIPKVNTNQLSLTFRFSWSR